MLKQRIVILVAIILASSIAVVSLVFISEVKLNVKNNFVRTLPPFKITAENVQNLKSDNLYIAGRTEDKIYLGSLLIKNFFLRVPISNRRCSKILLSAGKNFKVKDDMSGVIESKVFYLLNGSSASIFIGSLSDYKIKSKVETPYFTACVPLSFNSYLFRSVDLKNQNVFIKQTGTKTTVISRSILDNQAKNLFATDGIFFKIPEIDKVIYIYYYKNQFVAADTNLKVLYMARTIDTNSHIEINIAKIKSTSQLTMASQPLVVNKQASANHKNIFILSSLKADNETTRFRNETSVIDVYALKDGKYQFSFYLPDFNGKKLTDFKVYDQTLVALFENYLYTFKLNF